MIFNSIEYFAFLPIVLMTYWALPHRGRNLLLLMASYVFYGWWDWRFLGLIILSSVVDFTIGDRLHRTEDPRRRKHLLAASLATNLGLLGVFKYFNFFTDSAESMLLRLGLEPSWPVLTIALPVGISFYTFQTLSYTFDLYRRRLEPADSLLTFATFVAFFPQLVAGPIERARNLLPQFQAPRIAPSTDGVLTGCGLIVLGLVQKVAIADVVAPIANEGFDSPESMAGLSLVVSVLAFSLQIYGDFAGYSNIARGSARLFGIELMHNFREPYLSRNITEFWRRWHISLSSWLRDYLYIPLGGNRTGTAGTYRNLMITMLLGGLWHGAAWNFVIWGGLHGLLLSVHRLPFLDRAVGDDADQVTFRDVPRIMLTFGAVSLVWVFFRATSFGDALSLLEGIATMQAGRRLSLDSVVLVALAASAAVVIDLALRRREVHVSRAERRPVLAGSLTGVAVVAVIVFSGVVQVPFIYFQF